MGKEIRKVPKGWEHPKGEDGLYQPLFDENYQLVMEVWTKNHNQWLSGEHPDQKVEDNKRFRYYAEYDTNPPLVEYYRKYEDDECSCFQMYENVSEGTPISPVFDTLIDVENWLVTELGYSRNAAQSFCAEGYAPSFILTGDGIIDGIAGYDL